MKYLYNKADFLWNTTTTVKVSDVDSNWCYFKQVNSSLGYFNEGLLHQSRGPLRPLTEALCQINMDVVSHWAYTRADFPLNGRTVSMSAVEFLSVNDWEIRGQHSSPLQRTSGMEEEGKHLPVYCYCAALSARARHIKVPLQNVVWGLFKIYSSVRNLFPFEFLP